MLSWPGNSWVYWAVSAATVFLLLRVFVYGGRFSPKFCRACLAITAGGAVSVIIVGLTPGIADVSSTALTNPAWWISPALWLGGSLLAAAALFLLARALFADRSRGRRRCPRCWYDMSASPGLKCPECGRDAKSEDRLFRTRRRKWLAALFLLLMAVGTSLAATPWFGETAWEKRTPDWVVLLALPFVEDARAPGRSFGTRLADLAELRIYSHWPSRTGSLSQHLLDGQAPQWKRWLAFQSASLSARKGASATAQQLAIGLAMALKDDADRIAPYIENLCREAQTPEIRAGALMYLADLPAQHSRAQTVAMELALESDSRLRAAAAEAMGLLGRHTEPHAPPTALLLLVADADPTVQLAAIGSLPSFTPTNECVQALEACVTSRSLATAGTINVSDRVASSALSTLVRIKPDSAVAINCASNLLRSDSFADVRFIAEIMASAAWIEADLLSTLAEKLESKAELWVVRIILDDFAAADSLTAEQSVEVLSYLGRRPLVRFYVAEAFAFLADRGRDALPRLHQLAAEWDSTDPRAASRLRKSIEIIEGKTDSEDSR